MKSCITAIKSITVVGLGIAGWLALPSPALAQDYLTPSDVLLATEMASEEILDQSTTRTSLRFAGLDFYPRASVTAVYDDNLTIRPDHELRDFAWTIAPGFMIAAGDLALYLPGPATLGQVRNLLNYSLKDNPSVPQRYFGLDYSPSINVFTDHNEYDSVDHSVGLSGGYSFSKLAIGLDQDFSHQASKENETGNRLTQNRYNTRLRLRYEFNDRSSLEAQGQYLRVDYAEGGNRGYEECRNEDWFDRRVGGRSQLGLGAAFGFVNPEVGGDQTYQQVLLRGLYLLTGKLNLRAGGGIEFRQFDARVQSTIEPVFSVAAIYQPRMTTVVTLEAHRRVNPSIGGDSNRKSYGLSAGFRQRIFGQLATELTVAYDRVSYDLLTAGPSNHRKDDYLSGRASLEYEFNRQLQARIFYQYRHNDSSIGTRTYGNNEGGIQVSWRY